MFCIELIASLSENGRNSVKFPRPVSFLFFLFKNNNNRSSKTKADIVFSVPTCFIRISITCTMASSFECVKPVELVTMSRLVIQASFFSFLAYSKSKFQFFLKPPTWSKSMSSNYELGEEKK